MRGLAFIVLVLALSACARDRNFTPIQPAAAEIGTVHSIFAGTTRGRSPDGSFRSARSPNLTLLELDVSVPPTHRPGQLRFGYANPDPSTDFVIAGETIFASPADFRDRLTSQLRDRPPGQRNVSVFAHGFNATQIETAYRAAQISHDIGTNAVRAIYSWPSRGRVTGYVHDNDSMMFARDGLAAYLRELRAATPDRLVLISHSMGAMLAMEVLRQMDLQNPGWPARNLDAVVLMSPDLDIDIFRQQVSQLSAVPQPFVVFSSSRDLALVVSARLRGTAGRQRLGNISSIAPLSDLPIEIIDKTEFNTDAASSHFKAVTSPEILQLLAEAVASFDVFQSEDPSIVGTLTGEVTASGNAVKLRLQNPLSR